MLVWFQLVLVKALVTPRYPAQDYRGGPSSADGISESVGLETVVTATSLSQELSLVT